MALVEVCGVSYHMNTKLKSKWDKLKDGTLAKVDEDRVYITDGREGCGKSLFTIQQAAYIDPTVIEGNLDRICFTPEAVLKAIRETKSTKEHTKVIIFDEAFRGMSSKSALSTVNKQLVQAMMEMRQQNLVLFIVSPSFFLLEMYAAVLRSEALFHIKKDRKSKKRVFQAFNYKKKAAIYQIGIKRGWSYPKSTNHRGNFYNKYPGGDEFEKKYRKKKFDSLKEMDVIKKNEENKKIAKFREYYHKLVYLVLKELNLSVRKTSKLLKEYDINLSPSTVGIIFKEIKPIMEGTAKEGGDKIEVITPVKSVNGV